MLEKILDLPARSRSRLREAPASAGVGRSAKAGPTKRVEEPRALARGAPPYCSFRIRLRENPNLFV